MSEQNDKKFTSNHRQMMRIRGLDPKNYTLVKDTYTSLYLRDKRDGSLKILYKKSAHL